MPGRRSVPCEERWDPRARPPRDQSDQRFMSGPDGELLDVSQWPDPDWVEDVIPQWVRDYPTDRHITFNRAQE